MNRPRIITTSSDGDGTLEWLSDGWYQMKQHGTPEAESLMSRAKRAIEAADNVPDAIARLEKAGFEVVREGE